MSVIGRYLSMGGLAAASFFIAVSAGAGELPPATSPRLLVVKAGNAVDTLDAWRAIICDEFAASDSGAVDGDTDRPVGARIAISALASSGSVIPLTDLSYIFPQAGMYVLRNGQVFQANPLALSSLDRTHRMLDLDRRGVVLRRSNSLDGALVAVPSRTTLRVGAECRTVRAVLGVPQEELVLRPLDDAELVIFQPDALPRALNDLNRVRAGALPLNRPAANLGEPQGSSGHERSRS